VLHPGTLRAAANRTSSTWRRPWTWTPKWFAPHVAYTMAKMGMSLCTLGMSAEFAADGIAVNSLWPLTAIDTAAVRNVLGGDGGQGQPHAGHHGRLGLRDPVAPVPRVHGQFLHRRGAAARRGGHGLQTQYAVDPAHDLFRDFFVPDSIAEGLPTKTLAWPRLRAVYASGGT
jgi:citronellol/citronellal dehydrogenase